MRAANPGIIVLRITGFGQTGPYSDRAAFGTVVEAMSGFSAITGDPDGPPILPPFGLADSIAGMTGAGAVAMALYHRETSGGEGQEIDLSLLAPLMSVVGIGPAIYQRTGALQPRYGNRGGDGGASPRNVYQTADGQWVALSAVAQSVADRVFILIGREDLLEQPWFRTAAGRFDHLIELDTLVAEWISERNQDDVIRIFAEAGAAIGPVNTAKDLLEDPQVQAAEILIHFEDQDIGDVVQNAPLFKMSRTPGSIRFLGAEHASSSEQIFIGELENRKKSWKDFALKELLHESEISFTG